MLQLLDLVKQRLSQTFTNANSIDGFMMYFDLKNSVTQDNMNQYTEMIVESFYVGRDSVPKNLKHRKGSLCTKHLIISRLLHANKANLF